MIRTCSISIFYHGSKAFEGCTICLIHNGLPNWWRFVTTCYRLSVRNMSTIEYCPLHVYECLWRHYFRTILLHFFPMFIHLVCRFSQPVTNCNPFWWPSRDWVYWTCMRVLGQKCKNLFWQTSKNVCRFIHAGFYCSSVHSTKLPACIGVFNYVFVIINKLVIWQANSSFLTLFEFKLLVLWNMSLQNLFHRTRQA